MGWCFLLCHKQGLHISLDILGPLTEHVDTTATHKLSKTGLAVGALGFGFLHQVIKVTLLGLKPTGRLHLLNQLINTRAYWLGTRVDEFGNQLLNLRVKTFRRST